MDRDRVSLWSVRKVWPAFAILAVLLAAASGLPNRAGELYAASTGATDATLTWKVSQYAWTFNSLAQSHGATEPAYKDNDNGFVFPEGQGTYDPATGETSIDFTGALQLGNTGAGGYKIQFVDPSIVIGPDGTGSLIADVFYCTGTAACANPWILVPDVVIVNFDVDNGTLSDDGSLVSLTVTPDYQLQGDEANPARRQFPPSLVGTIGDTPVFSTGALAASLASHFRDSGSGNDPNKPPAPITLTFAYGSDGGVTQTIRTEVVVDGALSISVAGDNVVLPSPVLNSEGTSLVSSGAINSVIVTDLRAANPGWSVNGQVSEFTSDGGSFGGEHLGWTPEVVSTSATQVVTPGAPVSPGDTAGDGLSVSRGLGASEAGEGRGTAELGADLELQIPTTTPPGEYSATLTLTVI